MKFTIIATILLSTLFSLHANEVGMVVHLSTEAELLPLYAHPFDSKNSDLEKSYVSKLEQLMHFDLANSGKIALTVVSEQEKQHSYFVKTEVVKNELTATLHSVKGNWIKKVGPALLTGELKVDRRRIHTVTDTLHKALFGVEGIASTRILYTVRQKFTSKENEWNSDIWEVDYDGGNPRRVLTDVGYCVTPQYAPPHAGSAVGSLFYVSYKTGQPKIYTATLEGKSIQRFTTLRGNQLMPTLSYKRDKVAFISDVTGNPDLFIQDFSPETGTIGKPQQLFTAGLATQGTPTFSPDGKKVAFVSDKDGSPRIYVINVPPSGVGVSGYKATLITKFKRGCTAPAWSPDGRNIAYCARVDGFRQIFIHEMKTGKDQQLTHGSGNKENATWAPNSLHLVYNKSQGNTSDLYILNLNQKQPIRLTTGSHEKRFPHWQPRS